MWDWLVCCRSDAAVAVGEPQSTNSRDAPMHDNQEASASAVSEEVVATRAGPSRSGSGASRRSGSESTLSALSRVSSTSKGKMKAQPPPASPVISGSNVPIGMSGCRPSSSSDTASTSYAEARSIPDPIQEESPSDNKFVGVHAAYVPLDPTDPDSFLVPTWSLRCMTDRQKVRALDANKRKKLPKLNPHRERLERELAHNKVQEEQRMLLELHGSPLARTSARQNGSVQGVRNLNKVSAMDRASHSDRSLNTHTISTSSNRASGHAVGDEDSAWGSPSGKGLLNGGIGSRNVLTKVDSAKEHQGVHAVKATGSSEIGNDMIYTMESVDAT